MSDLPFLREDFHARWSELRPEHIVPDLRQALERAGCAVDLLCGIDRSKLTFASVIEGLEDATAPLDHAFSLLTHMDSVDNTPELRKAYNEILPEVIAFHSGLALNESLWDLLKTYASTEDARGLDAVRARALDETMFGFRQSGADLPPDKKEELRALDIELAKITQTYSENVLDSTNRFELVIDDENRLAGLPPSAMEAARASALEKGYGTEDQPQWRFTLKAPSMIPLMEHVHDEEIRRQVWQASALVGSEEPNDNSKLVWQILRLRQQKAELLGKPHFAVLVLERRMAKHGNAALGFVEDLHRRTRDSFQREVIDLQEFKAETLGRPTDLLEPWEVAYWAERRRRALYDLDEEELRPYFPIKPVLDGMFRLAEMLFDVRFRERETVVVKEPASAPARSLNPDDDGPVEVWDSEVRFYELHDHQGVHLGSFYADWHPRDGKRAGAWMGSLRTGRPPSGDRDREPHLGYICGNMTPPVNGRMALLTHDEVLTIFHEFGHLLHHLFGEVPVKSLNGTSVPWDFVELPSQLMENFCWQRESLDFFARHHETGEPIPNKLFKKMLAARNYNAGLAMMRQLSLGKLDLELHINHARDAERDLDELAHEILADYQIPTRTRPPTMARRFSHLFAHSTGYASGYYSYKWAEVLDADAFTLFEDHGVLSPEIGRKLRETVLSRGNSKDPAQLFRDFMGRDPDPEALLRRSGLIA